MFHRLVAGARILRLREAGVAVESCALCEFPLSVRLAKNEIGVRCPRCGASAIAQSLVDVLCRVCPNLSDACVYELSAAGALVEYLMRQAADLVTSEFFEGQPLGSKVGGIMCQDVQRLTLESASFDLCTSTEVFEHVEDDLAGFSEILRVLKPGGSLVFTVPLDNWQPSVERTAIVDGHRINVLPPEYHSDRYRGHSVFAYRTYGLDIVDRLREVGFREASIEYPSRKLFGFARPIVVARN